MKVQRKIKVSQIEVLRKKGMKLWRKIMVRLEDTDYRRMLVVAVTN